MTEPSPRLNAAICLIDEANVLDPNLDQGRPKELLYAERMTAMLARFAPEADEVAQLAVRAQHIRRWVVPRDSYPQTREGYLMWRKWLYKFHADEAARLLRLVQYDETTIDRVMQAIGKKGIKANADTQLLEDVSALVFIEHYLAAFVATKPDYDVVKWLDIIRKTWKKMSMAAHEFALSGKLILPPALVPLIVKAVEEK
ncbi:MAG: DUF4202 domain-containing protein [Rhodocyclaceae bacterium]|nr:DUF4202 domain-containing protein [Rhodocyclaceae bacterium]